MLRHFANMAAIALLTTIMFLFFGPLPALPVFGLLLFFAMPTRYRSLRLAIPLALVLCLTLAGAAFAQEVTAAADGAVAGMPEWLLKWMVIANLVLTLSSRIADITPTDKDNKAIGFVSKLFNLFGGHVFMLNGDPNKKA